MLVSWSNKVAQGLKIISVFFRLGNICNILVLEDCIRDVDVVRRVKLVVLSCFVGAFNSDFMFNFEQGALWEGSEGF